MPDGRILLVGAGGHASVVLDLIEENGLRDRVAGCVVRAIGEIADFQGLPVLGDDAGIATIASGGDYELALGVGAGREMSGRARLIHRLDELGLPYVALVHPRAVVARSVLVGEGAVVMACAAVNPGVVLGRLCIVNTGAVVDHGCRIGENSLIGPGAVLSGEVRVGSDTLVGSGAVVLPGVRIGDGCVVAAGAVVTRDVADGVRVAGVPARRMDGEVRRGE